MAEEIKDVNAKIDQAEEAMKKYASKDTVISIGGYEFTPAKLMVAFTLVSSTLGGLYGAFEVYKDYQSMKKRIAEYVAPDLSELNKKMEITMQNSEKSVQYTQDIKNDLKSDIRRLETVVENIERSTKQMERETDVQVRCMSKVRCKSPTTIILQSCFFVSPVDPAGDCCYRDSVSHASRRASQEAQA